MSSTTTSCGNHTRTVRNDTVYLAGASLSQREEETSVSGLHEFVILAASVRAIVDAHHAGHRCNKVLNTGSYRIGSGASFTVRGLPPDCPSAAYVAIKTPKVSNSMRAACRELRILSHPPLRSHRNIVELLGIAWVPEPSLESASLLPVLVLELSSAGSLEDAWAAKSSPDPDISIATSEAKIGLCLDVAQGLKALHDCDVVHGDMKCQNILLFKDDTVPGGLVAKLADFGHSVTELDEREGLRGNTPPWNAPEDNGDLNFIGLKAADIYSLGFVLWRILAAGAHPFQVITGTGTMLDPDVIEMMKRKESTVNLMVSLLGERIDFFHWIMLKKLVGAVLFGSIHPNPMVRSLRNVVTSLDCLVVNIVPRLKEWKGKMLKNIVITPEGQMCFDIGAVFGEEREQTSVGNRPASTNPTSVEPQPSVSSVNAGAMERPRPKTKIWGKETMTAEDEEQVRRFEKVLEDRKHGPHFPDNFEESEMNTPFHRFTTYPDITPEEARAQRAEYRAKGQLPKKDRTVPAWSKKHFYLSNSKYSASPLQDTRSTKAFRVEGMSPFDSSLSQLATRIQREHPGASVICETETLSVPEESLPLEHIGRSKVRIIALVDPVTEVLRLINENGGYIGKDEKHLFNNAGVLPQTQYLSPNFSIPQTYAALVETLQSSPVRVRQHLIANLIQAHPGASGQNRREMACTLFTYYLEVEHKPDEALKWLLSSAISGDTTTQGIVHRVFTALGKPIPDHIPIAEWLWDSALKGSPVALSDLQTLYPERSTEARHILNGRYSGIGIDMFQAFDTVVRGLADEILRIADLEDYEGPADVTTHATWAREILSHPPPPSDDPNAWSPEWSHECSVWETPWKNYASDPDNALRDTFRIEDDMVYYVNAIGDTVVHYAASRGYLHLLEWLFKTYEPPFTLLNIAYETPLLQATRAGQADVVEFLLDHGANPAFPSRRGELPLHWVFKIECGRMPDISRRLQVVQLSDMASYPDELHHASGREIQVGAYVECGSELVWAVMRGDAEVLSCLLCKTCQEESVGVILSAINCAARLWEASCLAVLLSTLKRHRSYITPSQYTECLYRATQAAVTNLHFDGLLTQLLRHGTEQARKSAFQGTLAALVDAGAKPRATPEDGMESVLSLAIVAAAPTTVAHLLETGWGEELCSTSRGLQGLPPYLLAAVEGREEVFDLLVTAAQQRGNLDWPITSGPDAFTAYHWLAKSHSPSLTLAKKLHALPALYSETAYGSPFEFAVRGLEFELADFFLECGADIERIVKYGYGLDTFLETADGMDATGDRRLKGLTLLGVLVAECAPYLLSSIRYLLSRGARAHVTQSTEPAFGGQLNIFHIAAAGKPGMHDREATQTILPVLLQAFKDKEAILIEKDGLHGWTPLEWAVRAKNDVAVRKLLEYGNGVGGDGVGAMCWRWVRGEDREGMENILALLSQYGFANDEEERTKRREGGWRRRPRGLRSNEREAAIVAGPKKGLGLTKA